MIPKLNDRINKDIVDVKKWKATTQRSETKMIRGQRPKAKEQIIGDWIADHGVTES